MAGSLLLAPAALAQNVGGVFGPGVRDGDRSAEYRGAFVPEEDGRDSRSVHRLHYQYALNDSVRLRGVVQGSDVNSSSLEYDLSLIHI